MHKRRTILLFVLLVAGWNLTAQNPLVQHFTISEGLPSNDVNQIFQDSRKFIWIATDAGVAKYDGSRFTFYRIQDGLSSNEVVDIKEDSFGRIWFFHSDASLNYYFENTIHNGKNTPFLDSLRSKDCFNRMAEDKDRNIFFYNNLYREIFSLDSDNHVKWFKLGSMLFANELTKGTSEGMTVRYLARDKEGAFLLWAHAGRFKTKDLSEIPELVSDQYRIKDVLASSNHAKYILARKKNSENFEIKRFMEDIDLEKAESLSAPLSLNITSILEDTNELLWISTYDQGVYCYKNGQVFHHFDIKNAKSVIQDHENNIWICSAKEGVFKISPFFYQHEHLGKEHFDNLGLLALTKHDSNGMWCTNGKRVFLLRDKDLYSLDFQNTGNSLDQLIQVSASTLLIGETGQKPFSIEGIRMSNKEKKIYCSKIVPFDNPFQKIIRNREKGEISTFSKSGFVIFLDMTDHLFQVRRIRFWNSIYYTYYNCNDELIVNSRRNFVFKDRQAIARPELFYLNNRIVAGHLNINHQTELFCMNDDSLFLMKDNRLFNLSAAFEQPIDLQIKHLEYSDSTLFVATARNIFICENPLNLLKGQPVSIRLVNINFKSIQKILFQDGKLFIASDDGLTCLPSTALHTSSVQPPIPYFQSVKINDQMDQVKQDQISLISSQRVNIAFNCINFSGSPTIFSYKLEGTDTDWIAVKGNDVVLQNLSKGAYNFMLRVRKPTSPWSEPIGISIKVQATLWENPIFYLLIVLLTGGLGFLIVLRRKNIELQHRETEHQIILLEQKSLQAMMNPHFIFNSLGSIQNFLLHNKPYEAGIFLSKFASLIRQNINSIDISMINLDEEVDRLKNYLDIEKLRLGDKFEYHIEMEEDVESEDIMIPTMLIQPFVENAVWHGIAGLEGSGLIGIKIGLRDEKSLRIVVTDSGIGIKNAVKFSFRSDKHLNLGMNITKKRLNLLGQKLGIETEITYSENSPGLENPGTIVKIILPFQYGRSEQRTK